jgi:hypothetical protein
MPIGRKIATRIQPDVQKILDEHLPIRDHPTLLRSLLILASEGLKRDPYLLSEILVGAVQPNSYELRVYKKVSEEHEVFP